MNDDLSDDGGWMSDVSIDDHADLDTFTELSNVVYSDNDNESRGSDIDGPGVPEVPEVPATGPNISKRARKPKKEPKPKIFKPKKKRKLKQKNLRNQNILMNGMSNFVPVNHPYNETNSGVVGRDLYPDPCREIDCFDKMFPTETLEFIVAQMNRHYEFVVAFQALTPKSRFQQWQPLTERTEFDLDGTFKVVTRIPDSRQLFSILVMKNDLEGRSLSTFKLIAAQSSQCALALHRVKVFAWFYFKVIWATTVARASVCVMKNPKRARLTKRDILDEFDNPLSSDEEDYVAVDSDDGEVDHVEEEIHLSDEEDAEMAPSAPSSPQYMSECDDEEYTPLGNIFLFKGQTEESDEVAA
ncbi:hypothetical protein J6590_065583 [Homalodisca vitripennis]|nr:hypothetical protein J6590_065583 [Homalodisca vitripennis]